MRWAWAAVLFCSAALGAQQTKIVADFEQEGEIHGWEFKHKSGQIVADHATHGSHALKISANDYLLYYRIPKDWSGYDSLDIDLFVQGDAPVSGSLLIADEAWQQKGGTYWNRHNAAFALKPGPNTLSIPVNGLYRGEAGSRNNDIKSNIDPSKIIRFDIGFQCKSAGESVYIDNMRLTKESRPDGIYAFDFGPESQTLFPGFTPISNATVYGQNGNKAGLNFARGPNAARDDTFPTRLYQDYVWMDDGQFVIALPNGDYHVWLMYDDLGYWGGEQAAFTRRWIESGGETVWSEDRGKEGPLEYLYRFENIEPHPGDNLWDLYVHSLFTPRQFTVKVRGGELRLKFRADGKRACDLAALIIYPDKNRAAAEKWIHEIELRNRQEFQSRAIYLGKPKPLDIPADARQKGYWLGFPSPESAPSFDGAPGPSGELGRKAAQGQRISLTFAIRPLDDLGPAELRVSDLQGPRDHISSAEVDVRYVHHSTHRGFGTIAYTIEPESLRPMTNSRLTLSKDLTRQFWLTVHIPEGTPAGLYKGQATLTTPKLKHNLPIQVQVLDFALDEPDFDMASYGTDVPHEILASRGDAAWKELFKTIREAGMNTISGGPGVRFLGLSPDGKARLDFAACDHYMQLLREAGFARELDGYGNVGGIHGLHDNYVIGETGREWERKTGKPMGELLKLAWGALREHAERNNWLPVRVGMTDEPRVLDQVRPQLELARLYRENVPWVDIGGSYSVNWKSNDPFDQAVRDLFATFKWNAMNLHSQIDLDKAKQFGSRLYIYNQGRTRYSWGAYQWAEMHKGVKGRMQWHLLALHGYQFFDLDGREPDTAMINWGREGILPTLALEEAREGVDDFRYAVTLWNLAQKKQTPAAMEAKQWLETISRQIPLDQKTPPAGFMANDQFREGCISRIERLAHD